MKDERAHLQLFDLIAREWQLPSPAEQVLFNAANTAVAFGCGDGSIYLAATADKSSPNQRTRRAIDTGRVTIAPRTGPVGALRAADHTEGRTSSIGRHGPGSFIFAKDDGRINTLTPGGISVHLPHRAIGPVPAVAARPDSEDLAYGCGATAHVTLGIEALTLAHPADINAVAWSPDGGVLAVAHDAGLTLWTIAAPPISQQVALPSPAAELVWSGDGQHLAVLLKSDGFCLLAGDGTNMQHFGSFPAAVRSVAFNPVRQAIVASGAFRPAAWALEGRQNLISGKSGLTLIDSIATCPTRDLIAVGYANGLLSLAEIGRSTEVLLREDTGSAIRAMAWSGCGNFLALAGADGSAALVEFPEAMFKPKGE